jgi:hypothetical protein
MKGLLSVVLKLTIVTRPQESMTASSQLLVADQARCTMGLDEVEANRSHMVGLLRAHEPSPGLHRRKRNSTVLPSGETEATVPDLDHAIVLDR